MLVKFISGANFLGFVLQQKREKTRAFYSCAHWHCSLCKRVARIGCEAWLNDGTSKASKVV